MHAIRQYEFGQVENLVYETVPDPRPGPGQVGIMVHASGVHLADTAIRAGVVSGPFPLPELPMIPGREVAGVVDELGDDVDHRWRGKRVVVHLGLASGGYAERAVGNVDALHALPDDLGYEAAVAMMGTGRMTLGILRVAELVPDDVVLVTAAAGGIGQLLVQAARNVDAMVVGAAGGATKVERVKELGAAVAVDYTASDWARTAAEALGGREVTVVFDGVGGEAGRAAFDLLGAGGRVILYGWSAGEPTRFASSELFERGLSASVALGPRITNIPGGLRRLEEEALTEAASGRLVPAVQTFPLKDAAAAHTALETRASIGKVVLVP